MIKVHVLKTKGIAVFLYENVRRGLEDCLGIKEI